MTITEGRDTTVNGRPVNSPGMTLEVRAGRGLRKLLGYLTLAGYHTTADLQYLEPGTFYTFLRDRRGFGVTIIVVKYRHREGEKMVSRYVVDGRYKKFDWTRLHWFDKAQPERRGTDVDPVIERS